jgi:hypothetical protein
LQKGIQAEKNFDETNKSRAPRKRREVKTDVDA